jgi:HAD superfamily hydrolase (TIGR01509 family)
MNPVSNAARAALFDFDLTLMDTSYAITDCLNLLADEFGLRHQTRDEVIKVIGLPILDSWVRIWGESRSEWLDFYRLKLRDLEHSGFREFPDTRSAVERLRANGILTGVVTNRNNARNAVGDCGLAQLFDVIIGAEDVGNLKPHPEPLLKAMSLLGVETGMALYTGDTDIDMKTAKSAGVRGIGVTTGSFGEEDLISAGAEITFKNLEGVADFILREMQ